MDGSAEGWREVRRHRLLAAAARVFARRAYAQASMDDIAQEAGVGKPTLYRYFASKEALFAAVFAHALDELEDRMESLLAGKTGIAAQLPALIAAMLPTVRDHLVSLRFLGEESALADQSRRRIFRERRARIASFLERAIADGIDRGEVRQIHAAWASHFIIGMIWSGSAVTRTEDDETLAEEIAGILLNGMLLPGRIRPGTEAPRSGADAPSWRRHFHDLASDPDRDGRLPSTVRPREATS